MSHAEVQAFFQTYRDAFDRFDGDAVADLWNTRSAITNRRKAEAELTWWSDDAPMRANHRALCEVYRGSGYHHAGYNLLRGAGGVKVLLVTAYEEELARIQRDAAD